MICSSDSLFNICKRKFFRIRLFHSSYYLRTVLSYHISFHNYDQLGNLAVNLKAELGEKLNFVLIEFQFDFKDANKQ